jgi:hypothetical protein
VSLCLWGACFVERCAGLLEGQCRKNPDGSYLKHNALTGVTAGTCEERGIHIQDVSCAAGIFLWLLIEGCDTSDSCRVCSRPLRSGACWEE